MELILRPWKRIRELENRLFEANVRERQAQEDYERIKRAMQAYFKRWPKAQHEAIGCLCGKEHG